MARKLSDQLGLIQPVFLQRWYIHALLTSCIFPTAFSQIRTVLEKSMGASLWNVRRNCVTILAMERKACPFASRRSSFAKFSSASKDFFFSCGSLLTLAAGTNLFTPNHTSKALSAIITCSNQWWLQYWWAKLFVPVITIKSSLRGRLFLKRQYIDAIQCLGSHPLDVCQILNALWTVWRSQDSIFIRQLYLCQHLIIDLVNSIISHHLAHIYVL